jgi:hypothetical protein
MLARDHKNTFRFTSKGQSRSLVGAGQVLWLRIAGGPGGAQHRRGCLLPPVQAHRIRGRILCAGIHDYRRAIENATIHAELGQIEFTVRTLRASD